MGGTGVARDTGVSGSAEGPTAATVTGMPSASAATTDAPMIVRWDGMIPQFSVRWTTPRKVPIRRAEFPPPSG
ncbi:hypothetical protein GCM10012284_48690 [Mangrovihabitans endophyticus]|uniref:Uncharacterized protein n=1 Tax=Mangrovihabitans endophyticus TaxID=1751298 RepID=A0A8J3FQM3_9ACTN|nr:hypothetical protein GCM10012284_48690 [Mangrovihabitans endophyticus]